MKPFVPSDCDVQNFACMPIDISRLFDPEMQLTMNDAEWRVAMTLQLKSFHHLPAASIPDDDAILARIADFGRDIEAWQKVKKAALKGWVKCDDGRFYHPMVAEKALESWISKILQKKRGIAGSGTRWKKDIDFSEFDNKIDEAMMCLQKLNPVSNKFTHIPVELLDDEQKIPGKRGRKKEVIPLSEEAQQEACKTEVERQAACKAVWNNYCVGYITRYGSKPIRDAKVNTQVKRIVETLGKADAPEVMAYYMKDADSFYIKMYHSIDVFQKNMTKLHTQWKTGKKVEVTTGLKQGARATEGMHSNLNQVDLGKGAKGGGKF